MGALRGLPLLVLPLILAACSPDFIPIHYSRINSARTANAPLRLGPDAPGAFVQTWNFESSGGYRYDPAEIGISGGTAHLASPGKSGRLIYLETSLGRAFSGLFNFTETAGARHKGQLRYQISQDQSHWHYYEDARWQPALLKLENTSSAQEIRNGLPHFHMEVGGGQLFVRVFMISPTGQEPVELKRIEVRGISPKTDGWD